MLSDINFYKAWVFIVSDQEAHASGTLGTINTILKIVCEALEYHIYHNDKGICVKLLGFCTGCGLIPSPDVNQRDSLMHGW